jgi:TonB-dependent starch-binding outer membrane protein SusC
MTETTSSRRFVPLLGILGALALTPAVHAQQGGTVRGVVREASTQQPIADAQVTVAGTRIGAITDPRGAYRLTNVPLGRQAVRVRVLGFSIRTDSVDVATDAPATLDFALTRTVVQLEEVVVTGAGVGVERKQLGNTIATVDAKTIENAPVQTFSEAIAGREPGVQVLPSSGLVGEGARIRIRGNASLTQNNEPVVYLDGVRVDNAGGFTYAGAGGAGTPSRLDDINPEIIERVEILKGAAAATMYGSEANAGVIQIFTKRGTAGAPRFSFRSDQGLSRSPRDAYKPSAGFARYGTFAQCLADSAAWGAKTAAQTTNCRTTIGVADRLTAIYGRTITPYQVFEQDYINELFGTGYHSSYSGTVTGGGETVVYNVAGRLAREDGPFSTHALDSRALANDYNRKYFGSANLTLFPGQRFQVRAAAMFTDLHHETPNNSNNIYGVVSSAINSKPEQADCEESRKLGLGGAFGEDPSRPGRCAGPGDPSGSGAFITPREAAYQIVAQDAEHFNGNLGLTYQSAPNVKFELTTGIDVTNANDFELLPFRYNVDNYTTNEILGRRTVGNRNNRQFTLDGKGTWTGHFRDFTSNLLVGTQGFVTRERDKGGFGRDFPGPGIEVAEAGAIRALNEAFVSTVNLGALAQEQLGYRGWAFVTLGARWDRNSAFGESSPWAFYPKISVSLVPSDLPSWHVPYVSALRLRGAVGRSGLQPGAFDKFTTWSPLAADLGPGLQTGNLGNDSLRPEVSTERELGAEVGLFGNRLGLDVTWWLRNTVDALVSKQFAPSGGFINPQLTNIGWLQGKGWEVKLNGLVLDRPNLSINLFVNGAYLSQRIMSLGGAAPIKVGTSYPRYRNFIRGPDTLYSAPGVIDQIRYYSPGALLGAALIPSCAAGAVYRGGASAGQPRPCYTPGSTVPYDTDRNGQPDSEARLQFYLDSLRNVGTAGLLDRLNPMQDDEDGDRDLLDNYLGKPSPDWQGAFGGAITFRRRLQVNVLFEYKAGNYTVTNLTDAFRTSHPLIGRNVRGAAEAEATLQDPTSTPAQRQAAAMRWATKYKALSPYDGLNQNEKGDFLRWREFGISYTAAPELARRLGVASATFSITGRNIKMWTGYSGIDPEENTIGRGGGGQLDNNYLDAVDGWGLPLPSSWTFSVRFGF